MHSLSGEPRVQGCGHCRRRARASRHRAAWRGCAHWAWSRVKRRGTRRTRRWRPERQSSAKGDFLPSREASRDVTLHAGMEMDPGRERSSRGQPSPDPGCEAESVATASTIRTRSSDRELLRARVAANEKRPATRRIPPRRGGILSRA